MNSSSFLQLDFIIAMIHILKGQICIPGSVVRALRFQVISERLPVLIQTVCFCFSGKGAPTLFLLEISGTQTIISISQAFPEPSLTASERLTWNPFCKSNVRRNLRSQRRYNCLKSPMHARLKWDFRTDTSSLSSAFQCTTYYYSGWEHFQGRFHFALYASFSIGFGNGLPVVIS